MPQLEALDIGSFGIQGMEEKPKIQETRILAKTIVLLTIAQFRSLCCTNT
jgi:hypothetical protein